MYKWQTMMEVSLFDLMILFQCSVSCGTGQQRREVVCRHVGDTFCRETEKPKIVKNCTTGIPCFGLNGKPI